MQAENSPIDTSNSMPPLEIDIIYEDERWTAQEFDLEAVTQHAIYTAFDYLDDQISAQTAISIVLADNDTVQDLNKNYRQKDKPTNILSFPMDEDDMLGDLILAYQTVELESQEQKKAFKNHYIHLIIHGVLHLLGYDHIDDTEATIMENKEIEILSRLKIANPYN
jgi:probable rRNA maturation factor